MEDKKPCVEIKFCTGCRWQARATWMAQELLNTFGEELGAVSLIPGTGGVYEVRVNGTMIWSRIEDGGFPQPKTLKQRVRDQIDPERSLGHVDR